MALFIYFALSCLIIYVVYMVGHESGKQCERDEVIRIIRNTRMEDGASTEMRYVVLQAMNTICTRIAERK